jgi:aminoglycoside 3-N-acetyltransferase
MMKSRDATSPIRPVDIVEGLRSAGLQAGQSVVVHSSLSAFGWVEGGALAVLRALSEVIGPKGTLVMPTFTYSLTWWGQPPFDRLHSPSHTGRLTEVFRRRPGVRRSPHPTHSIAAQGPLAAELTEAPLDYEPLGVNSPLDRLARAGGRVLLLGVGQCRNSTVHVAESRADVPYLRCPFTANANHDVALYRDQPGGRVRQFLIHQMPGASDGFHVLEEPLRRAGVSHHFRIGAAHCQLMDGETLCATVTEMIRADPLLLIRHDDRSNISARRRAYVRSLGLPIPPDPISPPRP